MNYKRLIQEVNPMFIAVSFGSLFITYLVFSGRHVLTDTDREMYVIMAAVMAVFAFLTREKRLLTIEEAYEIAYDDSIVLKNTGRIEQEGRIVKIEDGVLKEVGTQPKYLIVATFIAGVEPKFIVYNIHPYTGYIMRRSKKDYWDAMKDPDLKFVFTPAMEDIYDMRNRFKAGENDL